MLSSNAHYKLNSLLSEKYSAHLLLFMVTLQYYSVYSSNYFTPLLNTVSLAVCPDFITLQVSDKILCYRRNMWENAANM
jgi:hypothetical protein